MGALIAAAALKIGLLKALAFKAVTLLVGKALLVSKVMKIFNYIILCFVFEKLKIKFTNIYFFNF